MRFSILFLFLLSCFYSYGQTSPIAKQQNKEWKNVEIGNGLSISCPFDLEKADISEQLSAEVKTKIEGMSTYTLATKYDVADVFSIFISAITYVPSITANLEGSLAGAKGNLEQSSDVKDLVCDRTDAKEFGLVGAKLNCNFIKGDISFVTETFVYTKENKMWMIVVVYTKADVANGKAFTQKLHDSIKLIAQ